MNSTKCLYEINTRVWLKTIGTKGKSMFLREVPTSYWIKLRDLGISHVWLMGIWATNKETTQEYCFADGLKSAYNHTLPDWTEEDVIGSPYAIDSYSISPEIGIKIDLINLKEYLNSIGLRLILDFVPNHFSPYSRLITTHQDMFLKGTESLLHSHPSTFFKTQEGQVFAHGKDPYYDAWQDTIQLNYFSELTRTYLTSVLTNLTELCDGIRCDMAMLVINDVFENTWGYYLEHSPKSKRPDTEFWIEAIKHVKSQREDFLFMAEAYWGMEGELLRQGFDYTYDKGLLDSLEHNSADSIMHYLNSDINFQKKTVRFLENHDENRVIQVFGVDKSLAAAVVMFTIPGMRFIHDGQIEGKTVRIPVQLGREPIEKDNGSISDFYNHLIKITSDEVFARCNWTIVWPKPAWDDNPTFSNFLVWHFSYKNDNRLVVINYSDTHSQCKLDIPINDDLEEVLLNDLLNTKIYRRKVSDLKKDKLYIDLGPYKSHIFSF